MFSMPPPKPAPWHPTPLSTASQRLRCLVMCLEILPYRALLEPIPSTHMFESLSTNRSHHEAARGTAVRQRFSTSIAELRRQRFRRHIFAIFGALELRHIVRNTLKFETESVFYLGFCAYFVVFCLFSNVCVWGLFLISA
jgi:hypothetical protein